MSASWYDAKVKAGLRRPEQAERVQSLKATINPELRAERQAQMLIDQAKNYIRNRSQNRPKSAPNYFANDAAITPNRATS